MHFLGPPAAGSAPAPQAPSPLPILFTGIVESRVPIRSLLAVGSGARLILPAPARALPEAGQTPGGELEPCAWSVARGQSIAVSGACLTVAELFEPGTTRCLPDGRPGADMAFDLSRETLERTWLASRIGAPGPRHVNLERALRLGERLDGHMVSGHVDGQGHLLGIEDVGDGGREFRFEVPAGLERYLIEKGSLTIDGISLTVVRPAGREFRVALIPLTLAITSLGLASVGDAVNLEVDLVGKWIERLLAARD